MTCDATLSRRDVLGLAAALFLPLHPLDAPGVAPPAALPRWSAAPRLRRLRLETHVVDEMRRFYRDVLGFPVIEDGADSVSFQTGGTRIDFQRVTDGSRPFYHFAFNIPENKLEKARTWLHSRVRVQPHARTGEDVIFFEAWNAHSVFFDDPSGNLVEFIARHTLQNAAEGTFTVSDVLYASEIGVVPADQAGVFGAIREGLGISAYLNSTSFLGDEHGILIVIPNHVKWIPSFTKSGIACPTHITIAGHVPGRLHFPEGPFEIVSTGP